MNFWTLGFGDFWEFLMQNFGRFQNWKYWEFGIFGFIYVWFFSYIYIFFLLIDTLRFFNFLEFLSLFPTTVSYLPRVISPQLRDAVVDTIWFINRNQVWNGLAALLLLSSSRFVWVSFKKKPRHVILQSFCRTLIIKWNWWKII